MPIKPLTRPHYHVMPNTCPLEHIAWLRYASRADARAVFRTALAALRASPAWTETAHGHIADRAFRGRRSHERIVWVRFSINPEHPSGLYDGNVLYVICRRPRGWCHTEDGV